MVGTAHFKYNVGMITVTPTMVSNAVYDAIRSCATHLRPDYLTALDKARESAEGAHSKEAMDAIAENARLASEQGTPICQDTGYAWVCLEIGSDVWMPGDIFCKVDEAVAKAYRDGALRMSMVKDAAFDRANTGNNTPAICEIAISDRPGARIHVMLKGGGSDNASALCMLPPGAGLQGIADFVVEHVAKKAANACPPLLVGVGVGATFDKVASLSKRALLRPIGSESESEEAAKMEALLLERINESGIGPGGMPGSPTALAVHLKTEPCHIAALPVAVNLGCCALRSATVEIEES